MMICHVQDKFRWANKYFLSYPYLLMMYSMSCVPDELCCNLFGLKVDLSLAGEDCQHAVTDEALCTVTGCDLGTDACHWIFKTKVNMVQGEEVGPLTEFCSIHVGLYVLVQVRNTPPHHRQ